MATSLMTIDGRTQRTRDFYTKTNIYFGLGKISPWTIPGTPDEASEDQNEIEELQVIKRITTKKFVREQTNGEINFSNQDWTEILDIDREITSTDISFDAASFEIRTAAQDFSIYKLGEKVRMYGTTLNDDVLFEVTTEAVSPGDPIVVSPAPVSESAGSSFKIISNLKTNDIHHLFYECEFNYDNGTPDQLPVGITYRQIGLLEEPYKLDETLCDGLVYLPASLSTTKDFPAGHLHYIDNRVGINRISSQSETIALIIEF